ncbi:MAG TPA: hypothetical protein VIL00_02905 [Pseudonocardiaceae bacterium]
MSGIRELLISGVRTAVPYAWGVVITWLVTTGLLPADAADQARDLGERAGSVAASLVGLAWYLAARWVERQPWAPAWLVQLLLGSTHQPVYPPRPSAGPVP